MLKKFKKMSHELRIILRRRIIKQYIKLTQPKSMRDMANYWPDMSYNNDALTFRNNLIGTITLDELINNNQCDKINIIGSGPSIKDLDIEKIKSGHNIFLNGAITMAIEHNLPIFAFIIMDATFVKNRFDIIQSLSTKCNLLLGLGAACAIAERDNSILERHDVTIFNIESGNEKDFLSDERSFFSNNLNFGFFDGGTVMSIAIQLAYHLKPEVVYLLGLDINNANEPRFYEFQGKALKSGLLKDYQQKILPFMTLAQQCYSDRGIDLYNCSPVSKLPYDIIPYSPIYKK